MSLRTSLRVFGYVVTVAVHITNIVYMAQSTRKPSKDKNVEVFKTLEYRYFTTWTFFLQIAYALLGVFCDILLWKNSKRKNYSLPKPLGDFRDIVFSGLVWPCSWVVFSVFWGLYNYDRSLIFPEYLDEVLPTVSNHVIHTFIIPVVVWELVFRPRTRPDTHARNVSQLIMHVCVYLSVVLFTYKERGVWLYPIFGKLYGTIYFSISIAVAGLLFLAFYYLQWPITDMIHGTEEKKKEVQKKRR